MAEWQAAHTPGGHEKLWILPHLGRLAPDGSSALGEIPGHGKVTAILWNTGMPKITILVLISRSPTALPVLCCRLHSREGTAMVFTLRKLLIPALLGIFTMSFVPFAPPVGATGTYAGETLTLALSGRAVQGEETIFVATGRQTDVPNYPGGFGLDVFAKDVSVSRTCSPSYLGEEQASTHSTYEQQIVFGLPQGTTRTFNADFVYTFPRTGQVVLCAYSTWVTDTAAAATLTINIVPASAPMSPVKVVAPKVAELR